jgi:hypothetical protein
MGTAMRRIIRAETRVDGVPRPWLFRRFIDGDAERPFGPPARVMDTARREGAAPDVSRLARGA